MKTPVISMMAGVIAATIALVAAEPADPVDIRAVLFDTQFFAYPFSTGAAGLRVNPTRRPMPNWAYSRTQTASSTRA